MFFDHYNIDIEGALFLGAWVGGCRVTGKVLTWTIADQAVTP
jgi:hypothetical protein